MTNIARKTAHYREATEMITVNLKMRALILLCLVLGGCGGDDISGAPYKEEINYTTEKGMNIYIHIENTGHAESIALNLDRQLTEVEECLEKYAVTMADIHIVEDNDDYLGFYWSSGELEITRSNLYNNFVIRHELIHHILEQNGYPRETNFGESSINGTTHGGDKEVWRCQFPQGIYPAYLNSAIK